MFDLGIFELEILLIECSYIASLNLAVIMTRGQGHK